MSSSNGIIVPIKIPNVPNHQPDIHMGVSINGGTQNVWFIMEDPIEMDELGVPPLQETAICIYIYICMYICMYIIRAGVKTYENYHMIGGILPFTGPSKPSSSVVLAVVQVVIVG